jgi:hypothetical protein
MRCYLRNSFSDHRKPTIHQLPNHPTSGPQFFPPTTHASKKPIAPLNPAASSFTILSHRHHKTSADSTSPVGTLLVRRRPRPPRNRAEIRRWCVSTWRHLDAGRYLTLITASSWSAVDEALEITSLGTGEIDFHGRCGSARPSGKWHPPNVLESAVAAGKQVIDSGQRVKAVIQPASNVPSSIRSQSGHQTLRHKASRQERSAKRTGIIVEGEVWRQNRIRTAEKRRSNHMPSHILKDRLRVGEPIYCIRRTVANQNHRYSGSEPPFSIGPPHGE